MGAGKSAVGRSLARVLGLRLVDTDDEVARRGGRPLGQIFEQLGERGFRELEREVIDAVSGEAAVVSLGGGAAAQPGAVERLAAAGTLVYLRARPETLLSRIGDGAGRPLLANLSADARAARLEQLTAERSAANERAAIVVDTDDASVDEVAERVARRLAEAPDRAGGQEGEHAGAR
jgi:shikimate kinase